MAFKVLHYINQFFAGIGGEDKADHGPEVREGIVGPGLQLKNLLGDESVIVATFICGDNYFATHTEEVLALFAKTLKEHTPDLVLAGPSFYAGRYGFACGHVINEARKVLGIPGIAGMNVESPAVEMFRNDMFIVQTGDSVKSMKPALEDMAALAGKVLRKEPLGPAAMEKYFHRGIRKNFFARENGGVRAVDMLLKKMRKEAFVSEYLQEIPEKIPFALSVKDLGQANVAILNTGGIVPIGNPDRIESSSATKFGVYSIRGMNRLDPEEFMSIHGGYDTHFVNEDPNRVAPVDVLSDMVREGTLGKLHEYIYTTVGTGASLLNAEGFGREIASLLNKAGVDAAIMVST